MAGWLMGWAGLPEDGMGRFTRGPDAHVLAYKIFNSISIFTFCGK